MCREAPGPGTLQLWMGYIGGGRWARPTMAILYPKMCVQNCMGIAFSVLCATPLPLYPFIFNGKTMALAVRERATNVIALIASTYIFR